MPTYEYKCSICSRLFTAVRKIEERDEFILCECGEVAVRAFVTAPEIRTPKTSRTFLDGKRTDGYSEEVKAAQLDAEAMNHRPDSNKYKELKTEAKERRKLNNMKVK